MIESQGVPDTNGETMSATFDMTPEDFAAKVEWEGGLLAYVGDYQGPVPPSMEQDAADLQRALLRLEQGFEEFTSG